MVSRNQYHVYICHNGRNQNPGASIRWYLVIWWTEASPQCGCNGLMIVLVEKQPRYVAQGQWRSSLGTRNDTSWPCTQLPAPRTRFSAWRTQTGMWPGLFSSWFEEKKTHPTYQLVYANCSRLSTTECTTWDSPPCTLLVHQKCIEFSHSPQK